MHRQTKIDAATIHQWVISWRNRHTILVSLALLLLTVAASVASAAGEDMPSHSLLRHAASASPLRIPRIERAPRIEEFQDMTPTAQWSGKLAVVDGFIQRAPDNGRPATESTEAYLGYDARALHVVFVAHDREPKKIRARMDHRESIATDEDQVGIYIDTFHDRRRAYQFECNALGVQDDSIYSEDADAVDEGFDTVWTSHGELTPGGYIVIISIPFKSLRFSRAESQTWNIALWRYIGRRSEGSWWPRVSSQYRGVLSQAAPASGLQEISPGRNLQFNPYVSWRAFHAIDTRDALNPVYTGSSAEFRGGMDAKAILNDSLVLDVTAHPDFSQVESDQPQIITNQRYEPYYPEKRPFFTENASYFDVPMVDSNQRFLFTRRIANPNFGARLTGKIGSYSLGTLIADDRSPGEAVPDSDPLAGKHALFDVFRVTHDLPAHSNMGIAYAERRLEHSYSRVTDLDTTLNIGRTWKGTVMGAYNWNRSLDGAEFSGGDVDATLTRVSRGFNYIGYFLDRAPGFQPAMSFYGHSNWREVGQTFAYQSWPKNHWITRIWSEVYAARNWHFNGDLNWEGIKPMVKAEVKHNTTVSAYLWMWRDAFGPQDFAVLDRVKKFPVAPAYGLQIASTQSRFLSFNLSGAWGTRANYVPATGKPPEQVEYHQAEADLSLLTSRGLTITNTYLFDQNQNIGDGRSIYNAHIARSSWNFQVDRRLSFRFIGQYNAVLANPAFTATTTIRDFNADFLITYLVYPGTAIYVGYNSNLARPDVALGPYASDRFVNDGRQLFAKISYLFRF